MREQLQDRAARYVGYKGSAQPAARRRSERRRSSSASDDDGGGPQRDARAALRQSCERGNRAPPHGGGVSRGSSSASDEDGGGSEAVREQLQIRLRMSRLQGLNAQTLNRRHRHRAAVDRGDCQQPRWASCIGGAAQRDSYRQAIEAAGMRVEMIRRNRYSSSRRAGHRAAAPEPPRRIPAPCRERG